MPEPDNKIQELEARLDRLVRGMTGFHEEIAAIRGELVRLKARQVATGHTRETPSFYVPPQRPAEAKDPTTQGARPTTSARPQASTPTSRPGTPRPPVRAETSTDPGYELPKQTPYESEPVLSSATTSGDAFSRFISQYTENARENLEKFIGENLISLIGIVVLVIGVGVGAKYAIDNNLISPLTRILIGYGFGFGLVGLAIKLRRKYENFSAVLISGGMAIMYFVTFFAYAAYELISQLSAFGLMVMFTGFTVAAALVYSRQIIAHIGLVGAYAVPFLLSSDSGNYLALFSYLSIVNTGILAVSLKKQWTPIFYTASVFTWLIFGGWFVSKYSPEQHFYLAISFLGILFAILYATKLAHAKLEKEGDDRSETQITSTLTVGIFYAVCFGIARTGTLEHGQYWIFFSYLTVATVAIVAASIKFYPVIAAVHAAPFLAWLTFFGWFSGRYSPLEHFELTLVFLGLLFAISYATTIVYSRMLVDERERSANLIAAFLTGILFFGFCAVIITDPLVETPRYWTLFSYLAAASIVILATSFKFYGRSFMYLVVPFVWVIFGAWFTTRYDAMQHFGLATVFAGLFFAIFYSSILFHRLVEDSFTLIEHTSLVLVNAFVFYGFGYSLLDSQESLRGYLGVYTAANGLLHLGVAFAIRAAKPSAVDVVQVLTVLILTFASIAIPVQFDGNVVTMVWAVEGAVLFWFGRTRGIPLFERSSFPVMLLATVSLVLDWAFVYWDRTWAMSGGAAPITPFANTELVTALVYFAAFVFILFTHRNSEHEPALPASFVRPFAMAVAGLACIALYNGFRMEIGNYFYSISVQLLGPEVSAPRGDLQLFNLAWQMDYTLFFLTAIAAANIKKFRSATLAGVNCVLAALALGVFATVSMALFYGLQLAFTSGTFDPAFFASWIYIAIRPLSYVIAGVLVYMLYTYSRDPLLENRMESKVLGYGFDALAYGLAFIVASCELINLMGQFGIPDATKLGLSILWGVYALLLIAIGIAKDKKHLRIAAMVLLAITLTKLFLYDIADLDTIPKTILFVTVGITLLVISFLYNKYKGVMFEDAIRETDVG